MQFVVWYCCGLCDFVYCMILRCVCLVVLCVTGFCLLVLTCGRYLVYGVGVFCSDFDDVWHWALWFDFVVLSLLRCLVGIG